MPPYFSRKFEIDHALVSHYYVSRWWSRWWPLAWCHMLISYAVGIESSPSPPVSDISFSWPFFTTGFLFILYSFRCRSWWSCPPAPFYLNNFKIILDWQLFMDLWSKQYTWSFCKTPCSRMDEFEQYFTLQNLRIILKSWSIYTNFLVFLIALNRS